MNTQLFNQIINWIKSGTPHVTPKGESISFNMSNWRTDVYGTECSSAMCIAGAAIQFSNPLLDYETWWDTIEDHGSPIISAAEALGIPVEDAEKLFEPWGYFDYVGEVATWGEPLEQPMDAYLVLEHYMKTGEVDWTLSSLYEKYEGETEYD